MFDGIEIKMERSEDWIVIDDGEVTFFSDRMDAMAFARDRINAYSGDSESPIDESLISQITLARLEEIYSPVIIDKDLEKKVMLTPREDILRMKSRMEKMENFISIDCTCACCQERQNCRYAYDPYNRNGDCLADK